MTETEISPAPLAQIEMPKGELFHTKEVARAIAQPQDDLRELTIRVRGYVNRGYLHASGRDQDDKRGSLLFDDRAVLTAAIMREAAEFGLKNSNAMRLIGITLQQWRLENGRWDSEDPEPPVLLADYVWRAHMASPSTLHEFAIEVRCIQHVESGSRDFVVALHDASGEPHGQKLERDGWVDVSSLLIPMDRLLTPIWESIARIRRGH